MINMEVFIALIGLIVVVDCIEIVLNLILNAYDTKKSSSSLLRNTNTTFVLRDSSRVC